ncbi:MAG: hydrolase [Acidimicrobiia bacterium]|nr:hydrolase [Acidimicrobiia bacterium]
MGPSTSPARVDAPTRGTLRVGLVQHRWHANPEEHAAAIAEGVHLAAHEGAAVVCLMELTLSPYFAVDPAGPGATVLGVRAAPEQLPGGPTYELASHLARTTGVSVHASLYEAAPEADATTGTHDRRGFNTAICVAPSGELVARTRKVHLPVTEGYFEDRWFRGGDTGYPTIPLAGATFGFPTCWDQWFPEVARAYSLAGADVVVYPTAIGSEPDHPGFDTEPLWERVITGNAIANGLHMVVVNRVGVEGSLRFYGSSFVCDPYGRVLAQAPRDEPCVLVVDLDLDARRDWLTLFPLLTTRRPDTYGTLLEG